MRKINQLVITFFEDESLRSRSLIIGGLPLIIFLLISAFNIESAKFITNLLKDFSISNFGSIWLLMVVGISILAFFLGFSPIGSLRIGGEDAKPTKVF